MGMNPEDDVGILYLGPRPRAVTDLTVGAGASDS